MTPPTAPTTITNPALDTNLSQREVLRSRYANALEELFKDRDDPCIFEVNNSFTTIQSIVMSEMIKSARRSVLFLTGYNPKDDPKLEKKCPFNSTIVIESLYQAMEDNLFVMTCVPITSETATKKSSSIFKALRPIPADLGAVVVDEEAFFYQSKNMTTYSARNEGIAERINDLFTTFVVTKK